MRHFYFQLITFQWKFSGPLGLVLWCLFTRSHQLIGRWTQRNLSLKKERKKVQGNLISKLTGHDPTFSGSIRFSRVKWNLLCRAIPCKRGLVSFKAPLLKPSKVTFLDWNYRNLLAENSLDPPNHVLVSGLDEFLLPKSNFLRQGFMQGSFGSFYSCYKWKADEIPFQK